MAWVQEFPKLYQSLSARRAWIEMREKLGLSLLTYPSLSARRAWIEITYVIREPRCQVVALRKESVDRNKRAEPSGQAQGRRSPQGERG